jgi:DNA-binding NarL/FixJ family response regulator
MLTNVAAERQKKTRSDRLARVKDLLLTGASNAVISEELHATERTVKAYMHSLFTIYNITGKCKRVKLAVRLIDDVEKEQTNLNMTKLEKLIINLVVEGKINRQISEELHLSENMVKNYLRTIYDKTGMGCRTELALWAKSKSFVA